ncbi:MAG: hypothetical protein ABL866_04170 [Devosia sp.]
METAREKFLRERSFIWYWWKYVVLPTLVLSFAFVLFAMPVYFGTQLATLGLFGTLLSIGIGLFALAMLIVCLWFLIACYLIDAGRDVSRFNYLPAFVNGLGTGYGMFGIIYMVLFITLLLFFPNQTTIAFCVFVFGPFAVAMFSAPPLDRWFQKLKEKEKTVDTEDFRRDLLAQMEERAKRDANHR